MTKTISFPHMADYYIPIKTFLSRTTKLKVKPAPTITKKTITLGAKYAPDSVCLPFKYNLGNFIESLEDGANILFTAGGGCRYRYYAEITKTILKDLGYDFKFYNLISNGKLKITKVYKEFKELNPNLKFTYFIHQLLYTLLFIWNMDKIDKIIRLRIGFEIEKDSYIKEKKRMLKDFTSTNSIIKMYYYYFKHKKLTKKIPYAKPKNCLKVGIIGELYTAMEPFATYFLEKELAKMHVEIKRYTNLSYLLWQKKFMQRHMLRTTKNYCKYSLGADGLDNVYRTIKLINKSYDGIIHTKPFGCTPEIGAIPIIQKICQEKEMPIIFFSYDVETSDEGIKTRLEAFEDLIKIRRMKKWLKVI